MPDGTGGKKKRRSMGTVPKIARNPAFTLLETMLAILILALLAGAVFPLVRGGLAATDMAGRNEREEESLAALNDFLGKTFRVLPMNTVITACPEDVNGTSLLRLTIEQAPFAFAWGQSGASFDPVALAIRPQANGLYSLFLNRGGKTLPLLHDVKHIGWRFFDSRSRSWREDWRDQMAHPAIIELDLEATGAEGDRPANLKFWLPPMTGDLVQTSSGVSGP